MLPGISGTLVTPAYIDAALVTEFGGRLGEATARDGLRRLAACVRDSERRLGPASGARAVVDVAILPLLGVLGYQVDDMGPFHRPGFIGGLASGGVAVASVVALPWRAPLDAAAREAVAAGARRNLPWALVCNGTALRICDVSRSWSRRWLSLDLGAALASERSARILWALARAAALLDDGDGPGLLGAVVAASDRHSTAVCTSLGAGVLAAVHDLVHALDAASRRRRVSPDAIMEQSIVVVYRVLFLLFAEARSLVPVWHRVYREAYALDTLWRHVSRRADARGTWPAIQAIARMAHAGCAAGDLRVTAFNGRLFAPERAPIAARARVPDAVAGRVLLALATRRVGEARQPIAYGDLGVEQLGAVYERVLEYQPVEQDGRVALMHARAGRKSTGTFYTPCALTDFVVRRTLAPLVQDRTVDEILRLRILDPAMGSGAFLVSACRYLAAACEHARAADPAHGAAPVSEAERAQWRRQVAERCLYGVDVNPMAVQVARLSLWLTTLAADRPLTFLDHHLAVGDSLVGARFADMARQPPPAAGSRRAARPVPGGLFEELDTGELAAAVLPERYRLAMESSDTAAAVRDKERRLAALGAPGTSLGRWKRAADLWCAAWFWPGRPMSQALFGELTACALDRPSSLPAAEAAAWLDSAAAVARATRCFHWELAFPEVFFDAAGRRDPEGGFDAVLGNPPWDVLRADEGEPDKRSERRQTLQMLTRFVRDSGVYQPGGRGHANHYRLFVERALQLVRPGGRFGLVLPGGLLADQQASRLRHALLSRTEVDTVIGFDNRAGIFPIHRGTRFVALAGRHGGSTSRLPCRFGVTDPSALDILPDLARHDAETWPAVRIDRALIERMDPDGLAVPVVSGPLDLAILADAARCAPCLASASGWHARFGRELNATDDRRLFAPMPAGGSHGGAPVIEGKCIEPFRVQVEAAQYLLPASRIGSLGPAGAAVGRPRLCYREVAGAGNKLTLIAAILPGGCISTHTVSCLKTPLDEASQRCLLGLLNSLVVNHLVRRWVGTHVSAAMMARLPVPVPPPASKARREIVHLVRRLEAAGVDGAIDAYARLNAHVARLYDMDAQRLAHVLHGFPLIDAGVRRAVMDAFQRIE